MPTPTDGLRPLLVDFTPHRFTYAGDAGGSWFASALHEPRVVALNNTGDVVEGFDCPFIHRVICVHDTLVGLAWEFAWGRHWGYSRGERADATGYDVRSGRKLWYLNGGVSGLVGDGLAVFPNGTIDETATATVLQHIHDETEKGLAFGFLSHDWRFGQETQNVIAEFAACLKGEPVRFEQIESKPNAIRVRSSMRGARDETWIDLETSGLDAVARFLNEKLEAAMAGCRVFPLATDGDWHAYLIRTADEITAMRAAGVPGIGAP